MPLSRRSLLAAAAVPLTARAAEFRAIDRKTALLAWAEEDLGTAVAADVASGCSGERAETAPNLFPPIPVPERNPYFADALKRVARFRDLVTRYPKGPAGNVVHTDSEGWRFINISTQALELTTAFCHPQSPMAGDPALIAPMLRRFSTVYEYLTPGAKNLADFGISPWLSEMYFLLRTAYPGLLLPAHRAAWEKAIEVNADAIAAQYGKVFVAGKEGTAYPNAHTHYINALLFAGMVLRRADYREMAEAGVKLMATCQYPDGGNAYIGYQNECFNYHPIAVKDMIRYWQITGNPTAYRLAANTRWYYPLSAEAPNVAEYSTSPCWKPYWNMSTGSEGAAIVAALTKCPHNLRFARDNPPEGSLWLANYYREDLKPVAAPDNYITNDRNIEGPRGRFGAWSFSGTSRDYRDDPRGKLTYVGAMALGEKGYPKWPLSAALHAVGAEVRVKPGVGGLNRWNTHLCLARAERNASSVHRDFAAITTAHRLSVYNGPATDWAVTQQWLFTPKRIAGRIELEALADLKAISMGAAVQLVSGRGGWGVRKTFEQLEANAWKYGSLIVRFHGLGTRRVETEYTDVFSGDSGKSGRIVLGDRLGGEPQAYAKGTRMEFLVEIHPEWSEPAASLIRAEGNIHGIVLTEGKRTLGLLHNATESPAELAGGRGRIWRSGQMYRAPWLEEMASPTELPAAGARESVPAHSHVILVQEA
jgi:hypothetical protein